MKKMLDKYRRHLLSTVLADAASVEREAREYLDLMTEDGVFADIDYTSGDRASWQPANHTRRLEILTALYVRGDSVDRETVFGLLDGWLKLDPQCPNWWYNMIGVPMSLGNIAVMLWDELDFGRRALLLSRISRGVIFKDYRGQNETGANLLWLSGITMRYALLAGDPSLLALCVKMAAGETEYKTEGIQPDGSFFQHGRLLYSGGYGRSFINSIALMVYTVDGTPFAFPREALVRLMEHVDGLSHMIHRGMLDVSVVGREYVREGWSSTEGLSCDLSLLASCDVPGKDRLQSIIASMRAREPSFDGVRYFPSCAYLSMQTKGVFISFSGMTPTLLGTELINGENFLGYNLSYGTHTVVMNTGAEYVRAHALWDYALIPGTSTPYLTEDELKSFDFTRKTHPEIEDFGGYSDGDVACTYVTTVHDGVSATVAAFATPYGMIILGNSLSDGEGREIITTVEQCLVTGEVKTSDTEVIHGAVRYTVITEGQTLSVRDEVKRGALNRNRLSNPEREVEGRVLTVTLERGGKDSYAYVISPVSVDVSGIEVMSNDGLDQSVKLPDGRVLSARL